MASLPDATNGLLGGYQASPLLGLAMGLLQSSGASRLPVTMGAALGNGLGASQAYQTQALQNAMQRVMLPYQQAKIHAIMGALGDSTPGAQQQMQQNANPITKTQRLLANANPVSDALNSSPYGGAFQNINAPTQIATPEAPQNSRTTTPQNGVVDPLQDPEYRKWQMLALAGVQGADSLAAQRLQMLTAYNPEVQQQLAEAKARGALGPNLVENLVRYAGRPEALSPGQSAVTGLSMFPAGMQQGITGVINNALGVTPGGQGAISPTSQPAQPQPRGTTIIPGSNNGMSGAPTGPMMTTTGGGAFPVISGQSPYNVNLAKGLAENDAKYVGTQQTQADTAAQANNNIDEMWQAYNNGSFAGAFSKYQGGFSNLLQSMGISKENTKYDNYIALNKNSVQLGMQLTKSLSSRPSQYEFKYISQNAIANPSLQPGALGYLMGQMQGANDWQIGKANFVNAAAEIGINPRQAASSYDTNASATPLAWASLRKNNPAYFSQVYTTLSKTQTGAAMIRKVEQEAQWMIQNHIMDENGNLISGGK
ncbi:MAG: hypothetical protein KGH65_03855 [Candidatus Micrarchaeota archaeon]|nr:hypothetical protein [Candidatus Micrarchaeota archaeon]